MKLSDLNIQKETSRSFITQCPFCKKDNHFYVYKNGAKNYICFRCGKEGTLKQTSSEEGSEYMDTHFDTQAETMLDIDYNIYHKFLLLNPGGKSSIGQTYLDNRLISQEVIKNFKLGYNCHENVILLPSFTANTLANIKMRKLDDSTPKYMYYDGGKSIPFNIDSIKQKEYAILCEGEFDVLSILSNSDYDSVIGFPGASNKPNPNDFSTCTKIYIVTDQDEAGENAASRWAESLGEDRCFRVKFEEKDINEWFIARKHLTKGERSNLFSALLANSKAYAKPLIKAATEYVDASIEYLSKPPQELRGVSTGISKLDYFLGGFRSKEVTLLTGETSSGKSTFATWLIYHQLQAKVPCLLGSFEMSPESMEIKLLSMSLRRNLSKEGLDSSSKNDLDISILANFYFIDRMGTISLGELKRALFNAYLQYNVRFVVLDHLHKFIQVSDSETEWQSLGNAVRQIVEWTKELQGLHLILIVQFTKKGWDTVITKELIKGSSSIQQDADNIIVLLREINYRTKVQVEKTRSDAAKGGPDAKFYLTYSPTECIYMEQQVIDTFEDTVEPLSDETEY